MCGRCACTRDPEGIQRACAYRSKEGQTVVKPAWVAVNSQKYFPSYNISPQTNTPVLLSGRHHHIQASLESQSEPLGIHESTERVLQVMKWGLIPSWHKDQPQSFPTLLNNCRSISMFEKPSFRNAINKCQRCVVLAEGFYEWKTFKDKKKQPYFIYFSDRDPSTETVELNSLEEMESTTAIASSTTNDSGRLLTLAGLYDIWTPEKPEDEALYTYTIITVDATETFGTTIHHRMPAVLEDENAVKEWLDPAIPTAKAVKCINQKGSDKLSWHPVTSLVGNVKHKSPDCIVEIDLNKKPPINKKGTLLNWFTVSPKKDTTNGTANMSSPAHTDQEPVSKKPKLEDS